MAEAFASVGLPVLRYGYQRAGEEPLVQNLQGDLSERRNIYSVSKTFTSLAIGMAEAEGKLSLESRALDFFPEFAAGASERHRAVTIRNLLQMASGKHDALFHRKKRDTSEDWAKIFFTERLKSEPGTRFFYANLNSYILGRIIEKIYGQKLRDFLSERLFLPLGYGEVHWADCPNGHTVAYSMLELNLEELLSFGQVLLAGGCWEGTQLVPRDYIQRMHEDLIDSKLFPEPETRNGYGYQLWRCCHPAAWRADGLYGQFVVIYPEEQAVFACLTESSEDHEPYEILAIVDREIFGLE